MEEEWRDIPGYEGLYQVSNFGRVKSLDRLVCVDFGNNSHVKNIRYMYYVQPGKIMKLRSNPRGYIVVNLTKDKKQKGYMVHRLVMNSFCPNNNPELTQVNHKDEIKSNNQISNLEWCTPKYNSNYGTARVRISEKQKYTNSRRRPVISIDEYGNETEYLSAWDASRKIGAYQSNIWKAIHTGGKCSGYYWKYKEGTV